MSKGNVISDRGGVQLYKLRLIFKLAGLSNRIETSPYSVF